MVMCRTHSERLGTIERSAWLGGAGGEADGELMRWCWRALSAASVAAVLLVALALLLFTPGPAIASQSESVWHPSPKDPATLTHMYDVNQRAMQAAGAPFAKWTGHG